MLPLFKKLTVKIKLLDVKKKWEYRVYAE